MSRKKETGVAQDRYGQGVIEPEVWKVGWNYSDICFCVLSWFDTI